MPRRRRAVLTSAAALLGVLALLLIVLTVGTRSEYGQERVRRFVASWLASRVRGSMYVGRISGNFFDGVVVDSIEIRDDRGELFIASGPATVAYDMRDLFDRRLLLRHLRLRNPTVHLRLYADGTWNFRRIFPEGQPEPIGRRGGLSDFIVLDSASIEGGRLLLTRPWHPSDTVTAGNRARVLAAAIADRAHEVRDTQFGPTRTWRWENLKARLGYTRLADPDSIGRFVAVRALSFDEHDPSFAFRNVRGTVRQLGDSVWVDSPAWRLPGSWGSARGKVVWGSGRPVRYSVRVTGDRISLADVAWIHSTFPRSGGGRVVLDIRNAPYDEGIVEYAVRDMDVRTHGSHLLGRMVVNPNGAVLDVHDVSLRAAPLDFDLVRVLNGGPLHYDWQGTISGSVAAPGGRLDRFHVERADFVFADRHVPRAITRGNLTGTLDISHPAFTVFHGTRVNIAQLDLRTMQYLEPGFPRLRGVVSGSATLDSLWTDVRFREASLLHRDGNNPVSRVTGAGRVTLGARFLTYDLALVAQTLSWTTVARSYAAIPLRGEMSGPIRVRGSAPALSLDGKLAGPAGALTYAGTVDLAPPVFAARGSGTFAAVDARDLLADSTLPATALSGRYELALMGSDGRSLAGEIFVESDSSRVGDAHLLPSVAHARLAGGRIQVDTLRLRTRTADASATGTVTLGRTGSEELTYTLRLDSLAAVRSVLGRFARDSLPQVQGRLTARGTIRSGVVRAFTSDITAAGLAVGGKRADSLRGSVSATDSAGHRATVLALAGDSLHLGGMRFGRGFVAVSLPAQGAGPFHLELVNENGAATVAGGTVARSAGVTLVTLDSAVVRVDSARAYRTIAPAHANFSSAGVSLDSLVLALLAGGASAGAVELRDVRWYGDSLRGSIRSRDADLGILRGFVRSLAHANGPLTVALDFSGSRLRPRVTGTISLKDGTVALVGSAARYERVTADIEFAGDVMRIRELSAETARGGGRRGHARIAGSVTFTEHDNPVFVLEASADAFRALDVRGLATLDVSTRPALTLTGPFRGATMRGSVFVDEGTVYLPERLGKTVTALDDPELLALVDTAGARGRRFVPGMPSAFIAGLALDDVNLIVGDDVWLRSSEANIELGGLLRVTRTPSRTAEDARLALVGTLNATRGTYVLNLAVVQPTFEVERGTLRFFGTPEINPSLDIRAIHTVRQPRRTLTREDVRILVAITGTLRNPQLTLSSADSLPLSQSDLLSYLVTGEPSFALTGTSSEYAEQLLTLGGRLAGTLISTRIPRTVFDIVEVRTGAVRLDASATGVSGSYLNSLYNTRVILGKQLSGRWYLGLSTGLCRANFAENLGLRLEFRFSSTYFAQAGIEPGSGELSCVGPATSRTFEQTPPQLGFDLFRTWRF